MSIFYMNGAFWVYETTFFFNRRNQNIPPKPFIPSRYSSWWGKWGIGYFEVLSRERGEKSRYTGTRGELNCPIPIPSPTKGREFGQPKFRTLVPLRTYIQNLQEEKSPVWGIRGQQKKHLIKFLILDTLISNSGYCQKYCVTDAKPTTPRFR